MRGGTVVVRTAHNRIQGGSIPSPAVTYGEKRHSWYIFRLQTLKEPV